MKKRINSERIKLIEKARRIVIKIGSAILTAEGSSGLENEVINDIIRDVARLKSAGKEIIIVSSGAIAAGKKELNLHKPFSNIPQKQAAAAIGQTRLMGIYEKCFKKKGQRVAQVLLTHDDLSHRERFLNARNTLLTILSYGFIPIVNENDAVATEEIKFGDNDMLSAMVTNLVKADLLLILSDVDGFYSADPRKDSQAKFFPLVDTITREIEKMAAPTISHLGRGGMINKIKAAKLVTDEGIPALIVNGKIKGVLEKVFDGKELGTFFLPQK